MEENICEDQVYMKNWANHRSGVIKLFYNSGSYVTYIKELDGRVIENKEITIRCKDRDLNIKKYAEENGFIRII